jgi:hypothetical protein
MHPWVMALDCSPHVQHPCTKALQKAMGAVVVSMPVPMEVKQSKPMQQQRPQKDQSYPIQSSSVKDLMVQPSATATKRDEREQLQCTPTDHSVFNESTLQRPIRSFERRTLMELLCRKRTRLGRYL